MNSDPPARFTLLRPIVALCDTGEPLVDHSNLQLCRLDPSVSRHQVQFGGFLCSADFELKTQFLNMTFNHLCGHMFNHEIGSLVFAWDLN